MALPHKLSHTGTPVNVAGVSVDDMLDLARSIITDVAGEVPDRLDLNCYGGDMMELGCPDPVTPGMWMYVDWPTSAFVDNNPVDVIREACENLGVCYASRKYGDAEGNRRYELYLQRSSTTLGLGQQGSSQLQDRLLHSLGVLNVGSGKPEEEEGKPAMELYDFQWEGVEHLLSGRFRYLGDGMGLGKTIQAITAIVESGAASAAVICPAAVVPNWEHEWNVWGDPEIRFNVFSYASSAVRNRLVEADVVVLDEAHYCKNRKAKRTQNALAIAARADRAFLLSGTPGRNMSELWTVFDALWPDLMGPHIRSYDDWLNHFCTTRPIKVSPHHNRTIPKVTGHRKQNVAEGKALLQQVMLRRELDDVKLELPPLRVTLHRLPYVELSGAVHTELEDHVRESMEPTATTRRLLGKMKAPAIAGIIEEELETEQYDSIVVGYHHREVGDILQESLKDYGVVRLDGDTKQKDRASVVSDFNDGTARVFLGQMQSAGEGLNLQTASEIVLVEPAWNPDPNRQFIKRIHRVGQDNPCRARVFTFTGTLDESVMENVQRTANMQEEVGLS